MQESAGSIPAGITGKIWSVGVSAAHLRGKEEDWVQPPDGPLEQKSWAGMYRGGDRSLQDRCGGFNSHPVHWRNRTGSWSNGTTPPWRGGNPGSIPGGSTGLTRVRKVVGYGWPGRGANAVLPRGDEGSAPLPSAFAPMVKWRSCLVSTEVSRVRVLVGVLATRRMVFVV